MDVLFYFKGSRAAVMNERKGGIKIGWKRLKVVDLMSDIFNREKNYATSYG